MLSPEEASEATKLLSGLLLSKMKFSEESLGEHDEHFAAEFKRLVELDYKVVEKYGEILVGFKAHTERVLRAEQALNDAKEHMRDFVAKASGELKELQSECDGIRDRLSHPSEAVQLRDTCGEGGKAMLPSRPGLPPPRMLSSVLDQKALAEFVKAMMKAHNMQMPANAKDSEATVEELCRRILENGVKTDPLEIAEAERAKERAREEAARLRALSCAEAATSSSAFPTVSVHPEGKEEGKDTHKHSASRAPKFFTEIKRKISGH